MVVEELNGSELEVHIVANPFLLMSRRVDEYFYHVSLLIPTWMHLTMCSSNNLSAKCDNLKVKASWEIFYAKATAKDVKGER